MPAAKGRARTPLGPIALFGAQCKVWQTSAPSFGAFTLLSLLCRIWIILLMDFYISAKIVQLMFSILQAVQQPSKVQCQLDFKPNWIIFEYICIQNTHTSTDLSCAQMNNTDFFSPIPIQYSNLNQKYQYNPNTNTIPINFNDSILFFQAL